MSVQHTKEPWQWHAQGEANDYSLLTHDGRWVISFRQNGELMPAKQEANARRIVACVNACTGIPTEELEDTGAVSRIKAAEAARSFWQQRDSVLNVLVSLTAVARRYLPDYDEHPEIQRADEIIERVTGVNHGSAYPT